MITIVLIIIFILWKKCLLNPTQQWNINTRQQKKLNKLQSQNEKFVCVRQDIHKDPENKLPFHKFPTTLHM
jgi:hypothetical protein